MNVTFAEYITRKYVEWRGDEVGNSKSIARFARDVLGITPQLLSDWMNRGRKPTEPGYIKKLYKVFGAEVYSVLGLDNPGDPTPYESFPADFRRRLAEADAELLRRRHELNLTNPDSPEVLAIAIEVFEKYGFKVTVKE